MPREVFPGLSHFKITPFVFPVFTSTSILRKAGSEAVPGIRVMVPAIGQRNLAPE